MKKSDELHGPQCKCIGYGRGVVVMADHKELRRMNRHRRFPEGTCAASRHSAMIAEGLIKGDPFVIDPAEYPHAGESIASTVGSLWQARNKLHDLGYRCINGRWVNIGKVCE